MNNHFDGVSRKCKVSLKAEVEGRESVKLSQKVAASTIADTLLMNGCLYLFHLGP